MVKNFASFAAETTPKPKPPKKPAPEVCPPSPYFGAVPMRVNVTLRMRAG